MSVTTACFGSEAASNAYRPQAEGEVDILEIGEDPIVKPPDGTERRQRHKRRGASGTKRRLCHHGLVEPVSMEIIECEKGHVDDHAS